MASSPSEGSALSMYVWRIKSAEGGEDGTWRMGGTMAE